jgi:hypothetical protein
MQRRFRLRPWVKRTYRFPFSRIKNFFWNLRRLRIKPKAKRWEIAEGVTWLPGNISVSLAGLPSDPFTGRQVTVILQFRPLRDLRVVFDEVLLLRWAAEQYSWSFFRVPRGETPVPHPSNPRILGRYPLLKIEPSEWVFRYEGSHGPLVDGRSVSHYVILSESGILEVLALPGATATWVQLGR